MTSKSIYRFIYCRTRSSAFFRFALHIRFPASQPIHLHTQCTMWRTTFTLIMALTFILAAACARHGTQCYTLSKNGTQYLDSTNSVLAIQVHADRAALEAGDDKGVRFHFPLGEKGWVVCEAHNDHYVGTSIPDAVNWATEDSLATTVALATIHIAASGNQVFINAGPRKHLSATAGGVFLSSSLSLVSAPSFISGTHWRLFDCRLPFRIHFRIRFRFRMTLLLSISFHRKFMVD
ncbi:hypothetical protein B0H14DRAFT_2767645 [Mycena olivaceomarginata]|nr:hypothetical protein B0H14DRAFT_2767645 [Mycena olivaceomarginata]